MKFMGMKMGLPLIAIIVKKIAKRNAVTQMIKRKKEMKYILLEANRVKL
jgi:hypothetical protein